MPTPEAPLPETGERYCPVCRSGQITPVGYVIASGGLIKVEQRCADCGIRFLFVRKPLA
jgi:hypothetical protein